MASYKHNHLLTKYVILMVFFCWEVIVTLSLTKYYSHDLTDCCHLEFLGLVETVCFHCMLRCICSILSHSQSCSWIFFGEGIVWNCTELSVGISGSALLAVSILAIHLTDVICTEVGICWHHADVHCVRNYWSLSHNIFLWIVSIGFGCSNISGYPNFHSSSVLILSHFSCSVSLFWHMREHHPSQHCHAAYGRWGGRGRPFLWAYLITTFDLILLCFQFFSDYLSFTPSLQVLPRIKKKKKGC